VPTRQVSNKRTRNNRSHNNQTTAFVPTEQLSAEKFRYKELAPDEMTALHQKRWTQHLN
jgi:hypothetical protein